MSNPIVWADVVGLAPELSALTTTAQNTILAYANVAFDEAQFKLDPGSSISNTLRMARIYLSAHLGTVTRWQGSAIAGPLIRASDGRLEQEFAVIPQNIRSTYAFTSYGVMLDFLLSTSKARMPGVLT